MKIEYVNINEIVPYENNPRANRRTINKLKELIQNKEIEFNVPIVVDKNNVIVKGHSRWNALKELGYETCPVVYSNNTDELNNEDRIKDNAIQELSSWKDDELSIEIREYNINPQDYDLQIKDLGYKGGEEVKDVTPFDVRLAEDRLKENIQHDKEFIEIVCDCCGEEFLIDRAEVMRYEV